MFCCYLTYICSLLALYILIDECDKDDFVREINVLLLHIYLFLLIRSRLFMPPSIRKLTIEFLAIA